MEDLKDLASFTIVVEILLLGIADLIIYVPLLYRLLLRTIPSVHEEITSDIPGNPHVFNLLIISLFQTLPEPNNLNLVWTRVPIQEDVLVRGKIPISSRMSSWSVYGEGSDGVPNTIELFSNIDAHHGDFEVILTKHPEQYEQRSEKDLRTDRKMLTIDTKQWKYGMCVMRNYLVPPGTEVYTPELITASSTDSPTPQIIRQSQQLISGPANLHLDTSEYTKRIKQFLIVNGLFWIFNASTHVLTKDVFFYNAVISIVGIVLFGLIYHLLYFLAKKNLKKFVNMFCLEENKLYLTSLKESSKASQPSKLHRYWIMKYSILKENQELQITGNINPTYQKYWSLVVYDEYGLPLPQFVYDGNVRRIYEPTERNSDEEAVYRYNIRMKNYGPLGNKRPKNSNERKGSDLTTLDISKAPKGYVLFRLVHPIGDEAVEFSSPDAVLLSPITGATSNKEKAL